MVINRGSSSLKVSLVAEGAEELRRQSHDTGPGAITGMLAAFLEEAGAVDAVGHRIVHGGAAFTDAVVIDESTEEALATLADFAPLHNPASLGVVRQLRALAPRLTQVACFDTSFHATLPAAASTYAVPAEWRARWPIRRFGFHGLSHRWSSRRAAELLGRPVEELSLVTAHIGAGASLCAVAAGRSVDTTMGFTPLEGLVMATRSGSVDPGLVLWLVHTGGLDPDDLHNALERRSGLLGLSGTADLREVLSRAAAGDGEAALAYAVYLHRLRRELGAMVAALGGVDAFVFTGGAGEASPQLRADACEPFAFVCLSVDGERNSEGDGDRIVSSEGARPAVLAITAREDLEIVRQVEALLGG